MQKWTAERLDTDFVFPDGTKSYFELSMEPIPEGIFILSVDKSEQKKANEKLIKVNRLYAYISAVNQSIVHVEEDETRAFGTICDVAVNIGPI